MSRRVRAALLVVLVMAAGACATGDDAAPAAAPSSAGPGATAPPAAEEEDRERLVVGEGVAEAVFEAAAEDGLVRWPTGTVTIGWSGSITPRDEEVLIEAADRLSELTGLTLRPTGPGSTDDGTDVEVVFAPPDAWPVRPEAGSADVLGVTEARWTTDGELSGATVAIDSTIDQSLRNQTIVHELVHAIGVGHVACPTSIIYGGTDGLPTWVLGPLDEALLSTWYDPRLPGGSRADELGRSMDVEPGGPACEPPPFVVVRADEGVLWCEAGDGARPCVFVDGLSDPPVAPLGEGERWVLDRTVYDYDPTRYQAVQVDGRRALCELAGGDRRPCQFTDGPGPLTGADLWTDGTYVYDSP